MILNCVNVCRYVPMSSGTQGGQRHCIHLELELQTHVNQQIEMLGLEFWSPGRTAHSFISPIKFSLFRENENKTKYFRAEAGEITRQGWVKKL